MQWSFLHALKNARVRGLGLLGLTPQRRRLRKWLKIQASPVMGNGIS
jgi:hypothetical protein